MFWRDERFESAENMCKSERSIEKLHEMIDGHLDALAMPALNVLPDFSRRSGALRTEMRTMLTAVKDRRKSEMTTYLNKHSNLSDGKCKDIFAALQREEEKLREELGAKYAYFPVRHDDEDPKAPFSDEGLQRYLDVLKVEKANTDRNPPIKIANCSQFECLAKEINHFGSNAFGQIQKNKLKGKPVNELFKQLIGMIRISVSLQLYFHHIQLRNFLTPSISDCIARLDVCLGCLCSLPKRLKIFRGTQSGYE